MRKSETLRGHGAFRAVTAGGKRIDGKLIRSWSVIAGSPSPSLSIGVTVYDRRLNAVQRNRVRRRMREAFSHERRRLAGTVVKAGVGLKTVFSYRGNAETGSAASSFAAVHADIAEIIDRIISRIQQQWPPP